MSAPLAYLLLSLLTISLGCYTVASTGSTPATWLRNSIAWFLSLPILFLLPRLPFHRLQQALLILTPLALALAFASSGQSGVHRWLRLGPLTWNVAFLLLPATIVALTRAQSRWPWLAALAIQLLLALQPDASQATAFAASTLLLRRWESIPLAALATYTWTRPDPLLPVPQVEGIFALAQQVSPLLALASALSLAATCATPLLLPSKRLAAPVATYFALISLTPLCGAFPVPLLGMGMSPILGFTLAFATLVSANEAH